MKARGAAMAGDDTSTAGTERGHAPAYSGIPDLAVAEACRPEDQTELALQNELTSTGDRIASARRFYNANVRELNTKVETVPSNFVAGMFSIKRGELRGRRRRA